MNKKLLITLTSLLMALFIGTAFSVVEKPTSEPINDEGPSDPPTDKPGK